MDRIRHVADISIRRGCGFALIGIVTFMVGLAGEAALAIRAGAGLMAIMAAVLVLKARQARTRDYRRSEAWLMLEGRHELPENLAQQTFARILNERYLWHARVAFGLALAMWAVGLLSGFLL